MDAYARQDQQCDRRHHEYPRLVAAGLVSPTQETGPGQGCTLTS